MKKIILAGILALGFYGIAQAEQVESEAVQETEVVQEEKAVEKKEPVIEKDEEKIKAEEQSRLKEAMEHGALYGLVYRNVNKTGFLVGVGGGRFDAWGKSMAAYDLRAGYQAYFGQNIGLRGYLQYIGGGTTQGDTSYKLSMTTLNLDLLLEPFTWGSAKEHGAGFLLGYNAGLVNYKDSSNRKEKASGFGDGLNIGVFTTLYNKHKLEATMKLVRLSGKDKGSFSLKNNILGISYSYTF